MNKLVDIRKGEWKLQIALQGAIWLGVRWGREPFRTYFGIHVPFLQIVIAKGI